MISRAITLLGWFGVVTGALGAAYAPFHPWLVHRQLSIKGREFGLTEERIAQMAALQPWEVFGLTVAGCLALASLVCGLGLLRRCMWSRRAWLALCVVGVVWAIAGNLYPEPVGWQMVPRVALNVVIAAASFFVLLRAEAKGEFARASA